MSRPHTLDDPTARQAVLTAADREFYAHGVAGVGMTEIRDTSAVSLKRLYGLYPSKRELVAAWLQQRHATWMAWFTGAIERLTAAGADPLLAPFDAIAEWAATPGYRGCAFLNTAAEVTEIDARHRAIIAAHKQAVTDHVVGIAARSGAADPGALGTALAVLLDGAIVQSAVFGSVAPIAAARSAAAALIGGGPDDAAHRPAVALPGQVAGRRDADRGGCHDRGHRGRPAGPGVWAGGHPDVAAPAPDARAPRHARHRR